MNLWQWLNETVEALPKENQGRLAELVRELPRVVVDGRHDQAEAMVPEAVALARALDHPWLEVFLRHWLMQSRILHRQDVTGGMAEVIDLLDFAHGERARTCPQSVCVTQDVASAYGVLDGPGYSRERIAVCQETLARIDASWPCFACISGEQVSALLDEERFEEAERFCREQLRQIAIHGGEPAENVLFNLCDALIALRRPAEVLTELADYPEDRAFATQKTRYLLTKCRALVELGRGEEAHACFVAAEPLQAEFFVLWARCARRLVALGLLPNDAGLGTRLRRLARTLRDNGSRWNEGRLLKIGAQLALARDAHHVARLDLARGRTLVSELRQPERLARDLAALEAQCRPLAADVPEDLDGFLAEPGDDPEVCLPRLLAAHEADPAHEGIVCVLAQAYRALAFPEQAEELLRTHVARFPSSDRPLAQLARAWADEGKLEPLGRLADEVPERARAMVLWYASLAAEQRGRLEDAAAALERSLALEPGRATFEGRLAWLYRRLERWTESLSILDRLVERSEPGDDDWERMVVATHLGEHARVRASAARLGFRFEGEGPIDEPYAYCAIQLRDAEGRAETWLALRISPVTARIVSVAAPEQLQRHGDVVLFDPYPIDPRPPRDDEQAEAEPPTYRAIEVLSRGGFRSYELDGVHPGDAALDDLRETLRGLGAALWVRSDARYRLGGADGQEALPGVYAFIAAPAALSAAELHEQLRTTAGGWSGPITYRGLLRELGLVDELSRQAAQAEALGLD